MDDDPGIREFYRALLSSHGYVALIAGSGHDALRLLTARENEVAIVVSDYVMPNMDGAVLAALIKRRYPRLPVLLFTASQISEDLVLCVDAVVEKPCPPQRILDHIHTYSIGASDERGRKQGIANCPIPLFEGIRNTPSHNSLSLVVALIEVGDSVPWMPTEHIREAPGRGPSDLQTNFTSTKTNPPTPT